MLNIAQINPIESVTIFHLITGHGKFLKCLTFIVTFTHHPCEHQLRTVTWRRYYNHITSSIGCYANWKASEYLAVDTWIKLKFILKFPVSCLFLVHFFFPFSLWEFLPTTRKFRLFGFLYCPCLGHWTSSGTNCSKMVVLAKFSDKLCLWLWVWGPVFINTGDAIVIGVGQCCHFHFLTIYKCLTQLWLLFLVNGFI